MVRTNPRERRKADLRRHDDHVALPPKKKQLPDKPPPIADSSVNRLKRKVRDLSRALEHGVGPQAQVELERAIAGYNKDLESIRRQKGKNELVGKYHMVRFFERQKATRHLKKANRRLGAAQPNTSHHDEALQDIHIAEVDLNYTQYFPLDAKYEGIYAQKPTNHENVVKREDGNGGQAREALASRPAMWRIVENCMREGTLEALRDGKMTHSIPMNRRKPPSKNYARGPEGGVMLAGSTAAPSKKEAPSKDMDVSDENDGSDGGFFEK